MAHFSDVVYTLKSLSLGVTGLHPDRSDEVTRVRHLTALYNYPGSFQKIPMSTDTGTN